MTDLIPASPLAFPALLSRIARLYGEPRIVALPWVRAIGDHSAAFADLLRAVQGAPVVLFPDVAPSRLDGFFHLRLAQLLTRERGALLALSLVVLTAETIQTRIAAGFAERFRTSWPFAQCLFVAEDPLLAAQMTAALNLPVICPDDAETEPQVLRPETGAAQPIALQIQPMSKRCGGTTVFQNQVEELVQAGFLVIRVYTNASIRRGPTLDAELTRLILENNEHAGAHIDVAAVPAGPQAPGPTYDLERDPAIHLAEETSCVIDDPAVRRAAARSVCMIANTIGSVGLALRLAPQAALLLCVHDDQAVSRRQEMLLQGSSQQAADRQADHVDWMQQQIIGIADICIYVGRAELQRLGRFSRRAVEIPPRAYCRPAATTLSERFDLLLLGDQHAGNIASLRWFLDEVWRPYLAAAGIRAAVVGRVGHRIKAAAGALAGVHFVGFVDDLDTFRLWCRVTVVPDQGASGVAVKLLTTLAASHPLSTTSSGLRGLDPAIADLLPAFDDPRAMAADILGLLADPARREERRMLVRRAHQAIRPAAGYLQALTSIGWKTRALRAIHDRRSVQWARVVRQAERPADTPYFFDPDAESFPLCGTEWDQQVVIEGWHTPEPWGRWTDGAEACLRVAMRAPSEEPVGVELDVEVSPVRAWLSLAVDDTALATIDPAPGPNLVDIAPDLLAGKSSFLLRLHVTETVCPAEHLKSPDERILGIGLRSIRLISCKPTLLVQGQKVPVSGRQKPPWDLLLSGWHAVEHWGCWSDGRAASLQVRFGEPLHAQMQLELDLVPSPAEALLTVSVNNKALPPVTPVIGINAWDLPLDWTEGQTHFVIRLAVSETICPAETGDSSDHRTLGIGLCGLRLVAMDAVSCPVGDMVPVTESTFPERVLRDGWHHPESWGTWSKGTDATLSMRFGQTLAGSFRLDLDLAPTPVAAALTLVVNGHHFPPVVPSAGRNAWTLPRSCTNGHTRLSVGLHVADVYCPAESAGSADDRVLGIGLQAFGLFPIESSQCALDEPILVRKGSSASGMLRAGWHRLEPWGCWTSEVEASMQLDFDAPLDGDCVLEVNTAPPLLGQDVTIGINDTVLEPRQVLDGINVWDIPRACSDGQTKLLLRILINATVRPNEVSDSKDDRLLGVGVRSVCVRRSDPARNC